MDKQIKTLQVFLYIVALGIFTNITGDIRDFSSDRLIDSKIYQKVLAGHTDSPVLSKKSLEYSHYVIESSKIAVKAYLLLGVFYVFKIFTHAKEEDYFTPKVITYFEKAGAVFINYCVIIFTLEIIHLFILLGGKKVTSILNEYNLPTIALTGIAFTILSIIFKKGQLLQEENDLTI